MKKSRVRLLSGILSVGLLASAGFVIVNKQAPIEVNAVTEVVTTQTTSTTTTPLTIDQLRQKALTIIPGTIIKTEYDYDYGKQIVSFDIRDKNGIKREIELEVLTGKVYDIDYEYDAQGNRFINKDLFEVNKTFEECQAIALSKVSGGQVLNHKQDVDNGLFIYEYIIKGSNGLLYEVDVETKNGSVLKLEIEDDYNFNNYHPAPIVIQNQSSTTTTNTPSVQAPVTTPSTTTPSSNNNGEASLRQKVLAKYPGEVLRVKSEWDDGMMEYKYTIKQSSGNVYKVEINQYGYITDVDFEGRYENGVFYDEDYYDWD